MKGRIDKDGTLYIKRDSRHDGTTYCPFQQTNLWGKDVMCGDWCPLFGEPYPHTERANPANGLDRRMVETGQTVLMLCQTALIFDEFTDEREETNENI